MNFPKLNLPVYNFKIKQEDNVNFIFDEIRKKYVVITPEEWVRQNVIKFLISEKKYPQTLMKVETGLKYNNLHKRADIVVYDKTGYPFLLVECKAYDVKITQEAFDQIARYNVSFKVPYLLVTNGIAHYCCQMAYENNSYLFLNDIPDF